MRVDLKGIAKATAKGRTYYYAWRGGPRLRGSPGSPEFVASYNEAHADLRAPDASRFRALVAFYKASPEFKALAKSTRAQWSPWLDRIGTHFGNLRTAQFDRVPKIRPIILRWRLNYAHAPRTADYGMQVLSRVLSYGVDNGRLQENACAGIKPLYRGDRAAIVWTDDDLATLLPKCSRELGFAVQLAAYTGLRLGDLVRLSWSHIGAKEIVISTNKSRGSREARIPLYGALKALIGQIPKRSTAVLTSTHGTPWTVDGLGSSFNKAKKAAKLDSKDLHFHDLRGTAATRFYLAQLPMRAIAEILAWEEDRVERIIRRYVAGGAAVDAIIQKIDQHERGS